MSGEDIKPLDGAQDGISNAISKLMEHPELISMVASALGNGGKQAEKSTEREPSSSAAETPHASNVAASKELSADTLASVIPMLSKLSSPLSHSSGGSQHSELLCALKPYLNNNRRAAIDYVLKISQMSSLLGGLNKGEEQ